MILTFIFTGLWIYVGGFDCFFDSYDCFFKELNDVQDNFNLVNIENVLGVSIEEMKSVIDKELVEGLNNKEIFSNYLNKLDGEEDSFEENLIDNILKKYNK